MSETKKKSFAERDLTSGKLFWKIPLFAIPMACSTVLQLLFSTVDLFTVANYGGGSNSRSAIGSNTALINLVVTLFVSMALGSNVAIGNERGAGNKERAAKVMGNSYFLAICAGIIVAIFGYFRTPVLLGWRNTPKDILENSTTYLHIYFLGRPFLILYDFGAQLRMGLGDSKRPLLILGASGVINVIADFLFVIYGHRDVAGVAYATIISEACSALFVTLFLVFNHKGFVRLNLHELIPQKDVLLEILKIGIPSGLQGLGFGIPNVLIQSSLYSIHGLTLAGQLISDDEIVAGSAAANTIDNYVFAITDSCAAACISFVGQNFGAKKEENVKKVFWYSQIWMAILTSIAVCIARGCSEPLLKIFLTKTQDGEVVNQEHAILAGQERRKIVITREVLNGIRDVDSNYLRGRKHSLAPALIILFGATGSRILFLYTIFPMETFHTRIWLYATFPISWVLIDLIYIPIILHLQKKSFAKFHETEALPSAKNN